jgi:hypothetical protein
MANAPSNMDIKRVFDASDRIASHLLRDDSFRNAVEREILKEGLDADKAVSELVAKQAARIMAVLLARRAQAKSSD